MTQRFFLKRWPQRELSELPLVMILAGGDRKVCDKFMTHEFLELEFADPRFPEKEFRRSEGSRESVSVRVFFGRDSAKPLALMSEFHRADPQKPVTKLLHPTFLPTARNNI